GSHTDTLTTYGSTEGTTTWHTDDQGRLDLTTLDDETTITHTYRDDGKSDRTYTANTYTTDGTWNGTTYGIPAEEDDLEQGGYRVENFDGYRPAVITHWEGTKFLTEVYQHNGPQGQL